MSGALPGTRPARVGEACGFAAAAARVTFGVGATLSVARVERTRAGAISSCRCLSATEPPELAARHSRDGRGPVVVRPLFESRIPSRSFHFLAHGVQPASSASRLIEELKLRALSLKGR